MRSYVYRVHLERDEDGRWSAVVPALAGCAVWGHSADEALAAVKDAAQLYIDVLVEDGEPIPSDEGVTDSIIDGPAVLIAAEGTKPPLDKRAIVM